MQRKTEVRKIDRERERKRERERERERDQLEIDGAPSDLVNATHLSTDCRVIDPKSLNDFQALKRLRSYCFATRMK